MRKLVPVILLIVTIAGACEQIPKQRDFPIIRTLTPSGVDSTGATFRAEIVREGLLPVSSWGFAWSRNGMPEDDGSSIIKINDPAGSNSFEARIDSALIKGVNYKIRAFAIVNEETIFGSCVDFKSFGSLKCKWSPVTDFEGFFSWGRAYGCSNSQNGFIVLESSDFFSFNPEDNSIVKLKNIPVSPGTGTRWVSAAYNDDLYFFTNENNYIYKYSQGSWSYKSTGSVSYRGVYHLGLSMNNCIYYLGSAQQVIYDISANTIGEWVAFPSGNGFSIAGCQSGMTSYLMTSNKTIWSSVYPFNSWTYKATFPGNILGTPFIFSYNDKLYIGSGNRGDFWLCDTSTDEWQKLEDFPGAPAADDDIFFFSLRNKFYIGCEVEFLYSYDLWEYDPK